MSVSNQPETPAETLARRIVERLVAEKLISVHAAGEIQPKLSSGTLRGEDWRLPIELGVEKEGKS